MNDNYIELARVFEHLVQDFLYPDVRADLMYHWKTNDDSPENKIREGKIVAYTHTGLAWLKESGDLSPEQIAIVDDSIEKLLGNNTMENVIGVLQNLVNKNILF